MEHLDSLPDAIKAVQQSLQPYIKQRQQVETIRRILALHLSQHVNPALSEGESVSRPLSLVHAEDIESISNGFPGLRKDYLRALRSNVKAREEFTKASKVHRIRVLENQGVREGKQQRQDVIPYTESPKSLFLDLVKTKRKHEKLQIIHGHIGTLSHKPSAKPEYLERILALSNTSDLPRVPTELFARTNTGQQGNVDLGRLVAHLEKSVLRAKLQLKREQKLLATVRATLTVPAELLQPQKLKALAATRNELINWMETELSKAGDIEENENKDMDSNRQIKGRDYVENQMSIIAAQYTRYTKARQALIIVAAGQTVQQPPTKSEYTDDVVENDTLTTLGTAVDISSPYIEKLMYLANEQKSTIQIKSHLTTSLSRELKEAGYGLDRLTHESHLLPTYSINEPAEQRKRLETAASFAEEITKHEKPDFSSRARAWVFAAESATNATNDAVLENLEIGEAAISGALQHIRELQFVLGTDFAYSHEGQVLNTDIWSVLHGKLGAIKSEE